MRRASSCAGAGAGPPRCEAGQRSDAPGAARDPHRQLERAFAVHEREGTVLGGVHFELTGENVTECIGGARGLSAEDLERDYRSTVDPRLNYEQALELAMRIARRAGRV